MYEYYCQGYLERYIITSAKYVTLENNLNPPELLILRLSLNMTQNKVSCQKTPNEVNRSCTLRFLTEKMFETFYNLLVFFFLFRMTLLGIFELLLCCEYIKQILLYDNTRKRMHIMQLCWCSQGQHSYFIISFVCTSSYLEY